MTSEMNFVQWYQGLPQRELSPKQKAIRDIAKLCKCSEATARNWAAGRQKPNLLAQVKIAKYVGKPVETLFSNY